MDCVFCNMIGGCKIVCRKQSMLMKPKESASPDPFVAGEVWAQDEAVAGGNPISVFT